MRTVLVIEDDVSLCWLLEKIIGRDYKVKALKNGFEAWYWLMEGNQADLIISDIKMPGMDGLELLENIRLSGLFNSIPFIILSGNDDPASEAQAKKLGVSAYVTKPFEPVRLAELAGQVMNEIYKERKSEVI
jgi:two-component system, chemotaxis family, chemotaxis protein CheY